jgi:hypothetical protein
MALAAAVVQRTTDAGDLCRKSYLGMRGEMFLII